MTCMLAMCNTGERTVVSAHNVVVHLASHMHCPEQQHQMAGAQGCKQMLTDRWPISVHVWMRA